MDRARELRDIVSVNCIHDKIAQMRSLATIIERARERITAARAGGDAASPDTDREQDAQIIADANQRVKAVADEISYCSGHELTDPGVSATGVRVLPPPPPPPR